MKTKWILPFMLLAAVTINAAPDGETLLNEKCAVCHIVSGITAEKLKNMVAPPMWGVVKKVKTNHKTREEGIAFIVDYSLDPSEEKMIFPKAAKERFGLMPSQKGNVTEEELKAIAEYLYR